MLTTTRREAQYKMMKNIIFTALYLFHFEVLAASHIGMVLVQKGEAYIDEKNIQTQMKVGSKINEGSKIKTGSDGFLKIVMTDKNVIVVTASTQMTINAYKLKQSVDIKLDAGSLRHQVMQKYDGEKNKYEVTTPIAVIGVRGTDFISEFDLEKKETVLCTLEGKSWFKADQFEKVIQTEKDEFIRYKADSGEPTKKTVNPEWLKKALLKHSVD